MAKKKLQKVLALLMAFSMLMSVMSLSALAAEPEETAGEETVEVSEGEIAAEEPAEEEPAETPAAEEPAETPAEEEPVEEETPRRAVLMTLDEEVFLADVVPQEKEMMVGTELQLEAGETVEDAEWFSSDSAIAAVDENGLVKAVAEGTVEIVYGVSEDQPSKLWKITVNPYTFQVDGVTYMPLEDGTALVSGYDGVTATIVIPAEVEDEGQTYQVAGFSGTPFAGKTKLKRITIQAPITSVPDGCFSGCKPMTTVELPDTVTSIGDEAFKECVLLNTINLPEGLESIGDRGFQISNNFGPLSALKTLTLPSTLTSIGAQAFSNRQKLETIRLETSHVTVIGEKAFENCYKLSIKGLPEGVTSVGKSAFYNCGKNCAEAPEPLVLTADLAAALEAGALSYSPWTKVEFTEPITALPDNIFDGCSKLESVTGLANVTEVGDLAFNNCPLTGEFDLDWSKVTKIGQSAFNSSLRGEGVSLELSSLQELGVQAFLGSGIEHIVIGEGVRIIEHNTFNTCEKLQTVVLPASVEEIGSQAFNDCVALTAVTIGSETMLSSLQKIGANAFNCLFKTTDVPCVITAYTSDDEVVVDSTAIGTNRTLVFAGPTYAENGYISAEEGALTLKEAIEQAHDGDTIKISKNILMEETISVEGKHVTLTTDGGSYVIIPKKEFEGPLFVVKADSGLTIDGDITYRLGRLQKSVTAVDVYGEFCMEDGTFQTFRASSSDCAVIMVRRGGVFQMKDGAVTENKFTSQYSAPVRLSTGAKMTMTGGSIDHNEALSMNTSAGVLVMENAKFTMTDGTISDNVGFRGAGVLVHSENSAEGYDEETAAVFTLNGGTISGNEAKNGSNSGSLEPGGAGVFVENNAMFIMESGTITGNRAYTGMGGGVAAVDPALENGGGKFIMNGGTISENIAAFGGGLYVHTNDNVVLNAGYLTGNQATKRGGGLYVSTQPYTLRITNALISNNSASSMGGGLWLCPMGGVTIYDGGAAIFDNLIDAQGAGADIVSLNKTPASKEWASLSQATISTAMLGGGTATFYQDGKVYDALKNGNSNGAVGTPSSFTTAAPGKPSDKIENETGALALKTVTSREAKEMAAAAATVIITGNSAWTGGGVASNGTLIFGTKDLETTKEITVTKVWAGSTTHPATVTINLIRTDAEEKSETVGTVILSEDCNWTYTFVDLDSAYTYSVTEKPVNGFTAEVTGSEEEGFTVTNTYVPSPDPEDPDDPDPVTPSGPKPPIVVVPEEPVPTTPGEEPGTEIPEEETPKAEVPETGDMSLLWLAMTALSGSGLAAVSLRKKRDEE